MTTVTVTQQHIVKAHKGSCQFCAIALALKDLLNEEYYPVVKSCVVTFNLTNDGVGVWNSTLPQSAIEFIQNFDAPDSPFRPKPLPITFQLYIPRYMLKDANTSKTGAH